MSLGKTEIKMGRKIIGNKMKIIKYRLQTVIVLKKNLTNNKNEQNILKYKYIP